MSELVPREHALDPRTGELLDLAMATPATLIGLVEQANDYRQRLGDFRQAIIDELARRADRANSRQIEAAGVIVEVNAPTSEEWSPDYVREALRPFVEAGRLDPEAAARLIGRPAPTIPPERVMRRELAKLLRSADAELRAALESVRQEIRQPRTARIRRIES